MTKTYLKLLCEAIAEKNKAQLRMSKKRILSGQDCIKIKPMSVNTAWQGKRFKSKIYAKYEKDVLLQLPKIKLPEKPYEISLEFAFSNKGSDIDNPVKPFLDILQKKYKFDDKHIYKLIISKMIVKKGNEHIKFNIKNYAA